MQKGFQSVNFHGDGNGVIATPVIGENGNWWIGNDDTGINARGEKGEPGEIGPQGPKGDQAADMSKIEALEAKYEQLNSDFANQPLIQFGCATVLELTINRWVVLHVTFPKAYTTPPTITVSPGRCCHTIFTFIGSSTLSDAQIYVRNFDSTNLDSCDINWIAVGK